MDSHAHHAHAGDDGFAMHVFGMWLGFVMSAGFVAVIIVGMARSLRARDRSLAQAREESLNNERLVALGTLATGTAHELGTPLATIALVARELKRELPDAGPHSEDLDLLISQAKKATPAGKVLTSQDKYVSQMKQELMTSAGTSFEPLLERYIGNNVVLEMIKGEKILEYCGVLKEYTADFVEIMDVDYAAKEDQPARKADLVVPRKHGLIRHLAE